MTDEIKEHGTVDNIRFINSKKKSKKKQAGKSKSASYHAHATFENKIT